MREKILNPFSTSDRGQVYVTVRYDEEKGRLSITGVEGPKRNGDCRGGCGQIDMHLRDEDRTDWQYHPGWDDSTMDLLLEVWDLFHFNDMHAGTVTQEEYLRAYRQKHPELGRDYDISCSILAEAGIYRDVDEMCPALNEEGDKPGYTYGSAWLFRSVPENVIRWLFDLPKNRYTPAWH